jgi:hypothetical protein
MTLEQLGGGSGGFTYTQNSAPSSPSIGETWFDTSTDGGAGKIYADLGGGAQWHVLPVQDELQSGRTRELLLLLQGKPVSEVVDPLNEQSGLSNNVIIDNQGDYTLGGLEQGSTVTRDNDDGSVSADDKRGFRINPNADLDGLDISISSNTSGVTTAYILETDGTELASASIDSGTARLEASLSSGTDYNVVADDGGNSYTTGRDNDATFPYTSTDIDITNGVYLATSTGARPYNIKSVTALTKTGSFYTDGHVTDRFTAPTTAPADFKAWESIKAKDVTVGGSTSANPVEFEILNSSDTVLNSSKIPRGKLDDTEFKFRDRIYFENAGSNGQSNYTISTTGDGGHFGIDVLTVVSVKQNGSVLDSANWSFDPPSDTVTIDTNNVTISSGDTIEIKYDLDVFDSTLQPRAYLNRESSSETSPSISHFRYEYIV